MNLLEARVVASSNEDEENVCYRCIIIPNESGIEILSTIKNELEREGQKLVKILRLNIVPKCYGCKFDQPNQLAHMDYGGCLYTPSDEESEKE